ncbi:MAG: hypothetical protein HYZ81_04555 [Nitrospinae bacterium]|nr:hypothetical protein [Nitrospinota bacterium]
MSCGLHDVLAFEDRGIPTVLLCTEPFLDSARDHAHAYGNPDYQAVRVGHPVASLRPEEVCRRADEALVRIVEVLTGQPKHEMASVPERH